MKLPKFFGHLYRHRWKISGAVAAISTLLIYLTWGTWGLVALVFALLGLAVLFGSGSVKESDMEGYNRRWKWDGSSNDDGLSN